jgi:hypothetical protein
MCRPSPYEATLAPLYDCCPWSGLPQAIRCSRKCQPLGSRPINTSGALGKMANNYCKAVISCLLSIASIAISAQVKEPRTATTNATCDAQCRQDALAFAYKVSQLPRIEIPSDHTSMASCYIRMVPSPRANQPYQATPS